MKTLLGLLLMALTTYAAPNAVPDTHDCDPRALDMNKKNEHENFLPFNKFVEDQGENGYYVPWATVNSELNVDEFQKFCSGATFMDKYCGITYYTRHITNKENPQNFRSTTHFYGFNKELRKVTAFQMKVKLADKDDYIFIIDESEREAAIKAYFEGDSTALTLPDRIATIFNEPFALHDVLLGGKVSIYVMCNSDYAWASVKHGERVTNEVVEAIEGALSRLEKLEGENKFKNRNSTTYITPYSTKWATLFPNVVAA